MLDSKCAGSAYQLMMLPRLCVGNAASCFGLLGQDESQAGLWVTTECSSHKGYAVQPLSVTFLCAGAEASTYLRSPQHPSQPAGLCFSPYSRCHQVLTPPLLLLQTKQRKKVGRPITYNGDPNSPNLTEEERRKVSTSLSWLQ